MPSHSKSSKNYIAQRLQMFVVIVCVFAAVLFPAVYLLIMVYHTLIYVAATALPNLIFTVLPAVTFALALGVVFSKQPVHSLLCLITIFFNTVLLYLYTGSEFLAFLFLIVYVGAIAILFLFVIMLLHLKKPERTHTVGAITPLFVVVLLVCVGVDDLVAFSLEEFFVKGGLISQHVEPNNINALAWYVNNQFSDILLFSDALYRASVFLFFLVSLLLLTAMLGAIVLATSATDGEEPKSMNKQ